MNKVLLLAGFVTVATVPAAFATEETNCTAVSDRHIGAQARVEQIAPVTAPAATSTTQNPTANPWADAPRQDTAQSPAVAATAPPRTHARKHPRTVEAGVPDSVLIGDTGTL